MPLDTGNPLLAAATAKAAQIAASFGMAVQSPLLSAPSPMAAMTVQPATLAPSGFRAPKLLVDKSGREVDEHGNIIISRPVQVPFSHASMNLLTWIEQQSPQQHQHVF
jgi:hypothetical protein